MCLRIKRLSAEEAQQLENNLSGQQPQQPVRRRGCLRGCLWAMIIYFALSAIFGLLFGSMFSSQQVKLEANTVYRMDMKGTVVEQGRPADPWADLLQEMPGNMMSVDETVGLDQILENIRLAKEDDRILGIYLCGGELNVGQAAAKEIREALIDFKKSGKWIVAYADAYSQINYYIASVADRVCLNPVGEVNWNGLSAERMYYTRLLEKIGVEMQILKVGTFKSAVEPYFRTSMSDEDRLQTQLYMGGVWDDVVAGVAASRKLSADTLNAYADEYMGLQAQQKYLDYGLVDTLVYAFQMDSILRVYAGVEEYEKISTAELASVSRPASKAQDEVAVLYAEGEITDETGNGIVGKEMLRTIRKIAKNEDVRAVVLRVNSPGGSADASEQIWGALQSLREKGIPVVVSMGDVAASGGYYISCGADYIYAEPTTITGSIGIFGIVPNASKIRDKIGVDVDGVSTNRHSDMQSNMIFRGMNPEETQMMQTMVERGYDLFTRRCAEGRHVSQDSIKAIGEGRVWLGKDAKRLGLIDAFGDIDKAIEKAAALAKLETYRLSYYPEVKDPIEEMLENLMNGNPTPEEKLIQKMRTLCSKPRIMALMPEVEIK
ncbi:MAG: signal peptide peptidase SppA [Paludibacteraceae bacterium]|nr:signal peptide peptidase SppA [Paludibacteraceae bacterium]